MLVHHYGSVSREREREREGESDLTLDSKEQFGFKTADVTSGVLRLLSDSGRLVISLHFLEKFVLIM